MSLQALIQFRKIVSVDRGITISNHCVSLVCAMSSVIIFVYVKISRTILSLKCHKRKNVEFANNTDQVDAAHNKQPNLGEQCLPLRF